MKILFDFFPVLAFFIAYYVPDDRAQALYIATAVAVVAAIIQVTASWLIRKKVEKMHIITLLIILLLGGATLLFHDKRFFMWKPTAVNWLFAVVFFAGHFIGQKNMVQRMMDHAISAPQHVWNVLNWSWIVFFLFMGTLNIYVAYSFSEEIWVNFKLFGMLGLTIVFAIGQAFYLSRYISEIEETKE